MLRRSGESPCSKKTGAEAKESSTRPASYTWRLGSAHGGTRWSTAPHRCPMEGSLLPPVVVVEVFRCLPFQRFLSARRTCRRWYHLSLLCHQHWAKYIRRHSKAKILQTVPLYEQAYRIFHKRLRRSLYYDVEYMVNMQEVQRARIQQCLNQWQMEIDRLCYYQGQEDEIREELASIRFPLETLKNPRPCKRPRAARADQLLEESLGEEEPAGVQLDALP